MSDRLSVGILSAAHVHTDAYADLLGTFSDVDFAGFTDTNEKRGRAAADRHGTTFRAADDLIAEIDAAVVCSPNATHHVWIERAADAGIDVLCEKPLAANGDQADRILDACREAGINAGLVMPMRFSPLARELKRQYDDDVVGDLRYVTGTNRGKMPGGWFVDPELSGGGAIMDHTVHILNLVRWVTSEEVTEVYAHGGTRFHDVPVDDTCVLSMELESGTPFTLDGSWSRPDEWDTWGDATVELLGTDGVISIDSNEQAIRITRDEGDDPGVRSISFGSDPNRGSLRDFVNASKNDRDPLSTLEDGARELAVVEAAYESHERGGSVTVEY